MYLLKLSFIFLLAFSFLIAGCTKQQALDSGPLNPVVLTDLGVPPSSQSVEPQQNPGRFKFDPRDKVRKYIKYKEYDSKNECDIRIEDKSTYCVNIVSTIISIENGSNFIYVIESGTELDENKNKLTAHIDRGSLKFFKFEVLKNNKIKLISESDLLHCGPFGLPCNAKTYKYGNGSELAWVLLEGDMHQGVGYSTLSAYTSFGKKITSFLDIQTSYVDTAFMAADGSDSPAVYIRTEIITAPSPNEKFFDLNVTITRKGYIYKKNTTQKIFSGVIKFDSKSNSYLTNEIIKKYTEEDNNISSLLRDAVKP